MLNSDRIWVNGTLATKLSTRVWWAFIRSWMIGLISRFEGFVSSSRLPTNLLIEGFKRKCVVLVDRFHVTKLYFVKAYQCWDTEIAAAAAHKKNKKSVKFTTLAETITRLCYLFDYCSICFWKYVVIRLLQRDIYSLRDIVEIPQNTTQNNNTNIAPSPFFRFSMNINRVAQNKK